LANPETKALSTGFATNVPRQVVITRPLLARKKTDVGWMSVVIGDAGGRSPPEIRPTQIGEFLCSNKCGVHRLENYVGAGLQPADARLLRGPSFGKAASAADSNLRAKNRSAEAT